MAAEYPWARGRYQPAIVVCPRPPRETLRAAASDKEVAVFIFGVGGILWIILVVLLIVVGLAYRGGYFRARRPK